MSNLRTLLRVEVSIDDQVICLTYDNGVKKYPISTSKLGIGQQKGSNKTPLGWHQIKAKIGAGAAENTVFVGRRPTGEVYNSELARLHPDRDWILTRILWLGGCEIGRNRLGDVDTMQRYIYIHGTPDSEPMGRPESHGCIRMRNSDVITVFDEFEVGTAIWIQKNSLEKISCQFV